MIQGMGSDLLGAGVGLAGNELAYSKDPFGMNARNATNRASRLSALRTRAKTDLRNMPPIAYDESYFDNSVLPQ
jgi:hypothetical protein